MTTDKSGSLLEQETTELILRGFYAVYNELGHGFLESVYENALAHVLREGGLDVRQQAGIAVHFRGHLVGEYRADLLVPGRILVEIKAAASLAPGHEAQLINYLKATGIPVGLLLNFGPQPQFKRRVYTDGPIRPYPCESVVKENV